MPGRIFFRISALTYPGTGLRNLPPGAITRGEPAAPRAAAVRPILVGVGTENLIFMFIIMSL